MRKHIITRKIEQNTVNVKIANISENTVSDFELKIGRLPKENVLNHIKKLFETDDVKILKVNEVTKEYITVGMSEDDFIKYGEVL